MKRIKKPLSLSRETVRTLAADELAAAHGAFMDVTYGCPSNGCPTAACVSAANLRSGCTSCPTCGDCGLMKP